jgi:hypothetical protein
MPNTPKPIVPRPAAARSMPPRTAPATSGPSGPAPVFRPDNVPPRDGASELRAQPRAITPPAIGSNKSLPAVSRPAPLGPGAPPPVYRPNNVAPKLGGRPIQQRPQSPPAPARRSMQLFRPLQLRNPRARRIGAPIIQRMQRPSPSLFDRWETIEKRLDRMYAQDPRSTLPISEHLELARQAMNGPLDSTAIKDLKVRVREITGWMNTGGVPAVRPLPERAVGSAKTTTTINPANKEALWSQDYIYAAGHWKKASHAKTLTNQGKRTIINEHEEQKLYSTMGIDDGCWIGFVQNEWPCIGEGCCGFFKGVSNRKNVAGVIFTVRNSGGYATEHGREIGSSGHVYFCKGQMSYNPPPGAPPPP